MQESFWEKSRKIKKEIFIMDCLFCKIIAGEIPSTKVYEDETVYAFKDISPMAKVHVLIIPKQHIDSMNDINSENSAVVAHIFEVAAELAKKLEIDKTGYRVVSNCGKDAGQTVFHLHFHLLGGEEMNPRMA